MYIPRARERVRIAGRQGLFLVVWVDEELQCADLISVDGGSYLLEENVPFSALQADRGDAPLKTQ